MVDYESMYYKLFLAATRSLEMLQQALADCERIYYEPVDVNYGTCNAPVVVFDDCDDEEYFEFDESADYEIDRELDDE